MTGRHPTSLRGWDMVKPGAAQDVSFNQEAGTTRMTGRHPTSLRGWDMVGPGAAQGVSFNQDVEKEASTTRTTGSHPTVYFVATQPKEEQLESYN